MHQEELKINKDRIPILIGKNGDIKKQIELITKTHLLIDSKEGDVIIKGEESINTYTTKLIVLAVSRGFNPQIALNLCNEDISLEIINIQDFCGKSKAKEIRIKGRIIGTKGKSRHLIEQLTNTDICVYGKTVSIIGKVENTILARRAIEMLLKGSKHGNVYQWLEKQQNYLRQL